MSLKSSATQSARSVPWALTPDTRVRTETRLDPQGRAVHHEVSDPRPQGSEAVESIASLFAEGVTAPWRAARGENVDLGDVLATAGDWGMVAAPMRAPAGALRMFAGRKSRAADNAALERAERLAAEGVDQADIWRDTGWFRGADDQWRYEIDDSGAGIHLPPVQRPDRPLAERSLAEVLQHRPLHEAYPELADVAVLQAHPGGSKQGAIMGEAGTPDSAVISVSPRAKDPRSVTLHETQHGVQSLEGFARGGAIERPQPGTASWDVLEEMIERIETPVSLEEFARSGGFDNIEAARPFYEDRLRQIENPSVEMRRQLYRDAGREAYRRLAGEVEARNVQKRRDMTPAERRARPPWETEDVPREKQIVKLRRGDVAATERYLSGVASLFAQ